MKNAQSDKEFFLKIKEAKEEKKVPTKEEVLELRNLVTKGMTEEEISRLSENIKVANLTMEKAYLYDSFFERLEDSEDLYWNYVDYLRVKSSH